MLYHDPMKFEIQSIEWMHQSFHILEHLKSVQSVRSLVLYPSKNGPLLRKWRLVEKFLLGMDSWQLFWQLNAILPSKNWIELILFKVIVTLFKLDNCTHPFETIFQLFGIICTSHFHVNRLYYCSVVVTRLCNWAQNILNDLPFQATLQELDKVSNFAQNRRLIKHFFLLKRLYRFEVFTITNQLRLLVYSFNDKKSQTNYYSHGDVITTQTSTWNELVIRCVNSSIKPKQQRSCQTV